MCDPESEEIIVELKTLDIKTPDADLNRRFNSALLPPDRKNSLLSWLLLEAGRPALSAALFGSNLGAEEAGVVVGA